VIAHGRATWTRRGNTSLPNGLHLRTILAAALLLWHLPVEATERILLANQGRRMKFATKIAVRRGENGFTMGKRYGIVNLIAFGVLALLLGVAVPAAAASGALQLSGTSSSIRMGSMSRSWCTYLTAAHETRRGSPPSDCSNRSVLALHGDETDCASP